MGCKFVFERSTGAMMDGSNKVYALESTVNSMSETIIFKRSDFSFDLPENLIAQYPPESRADSRLMVVRRRDQVFHHRRFPEIIECLRAGDVLVFNDARVVPARIYFRRKSGARVEIVLAKRTNGKKWLVICNRTRRLSPGERLAADKDEAVFVTVIRRVGEYLEIEPGVELNNEVLDRIGSVPLPPYIRREFNGTDRERYQTVYAVRDGSAAAPTAGFHFTPTIMEALSRKGVIMLYLTLDISWGTFRPVRHEDLSLHEMHSESYHLPEATAAEVNRAREEGRRVIAVGTTSLRVLESTFSEGRNRPGSGETSLFIYPPRRVGSIDALLTNFHIPCSTLLMLTASFGGYELVMRAYREAVNERYRFFSYGDAMLIL